MGGIFDPRKIRRSYMNERTRPGLIQTLLEGLEKDPTTGRRGIQYNEVSIRDLYESLIPEGPELLREMDYRKSGGKSVREIMESGMGGAVNTGDFANISGQIIFNRIKDAYEFPEALWPNLCETVQSDYLLGERIPGVGGIGASAIEVVGEGEQFPMLGVNEEYIDAQQMNKRGFIVAITREMIIQDRTGLLLQRCADGGKYMGINKEFRVISCVTGQSGFNNYNRNGVATNTYLTSGSYINRNASNTLSDWTSVETAELLFDAMTDPNTGLPIILPARVMLVPNALRRTAHRIMTASEIGTVDNQAAANTLRQFYNNPMAQGFYGQGSYQCLSNAYVKAATGSATTWYFGDPKKQCWYRQAWQNETTQAIDNNEAMFNRDIWQQHKTSECGDPQIVEPRYMSSNG